MRLTGRFRTLRSLVLLFLMNAVASYSQTGTPAVTTNNASSITSNAAALSGTIDPGGSAVAGWFEWGTSNSLGTRSAIQTFAAGTDSIALTAALTNLQPQTTYYFRAVVYRLEMGGGVITGDLKTFKTVGTASTSADVVATTGAATSLTFNSATLNGTVNPGGASVAAWFDWGTSTSLGNRSDVLSVAGLAASVPVMFSLKNVQPHTTYYFRLDAYRSSDGGAALGDVKTFTTPDAPTAAAMTVTTIDATAVTSNSATLNGKIAGGGSAFGAWFEYGTTTSLGTRTDAQVYPDGTATAAPARALTGLRAGTTYYFRLDGYRAGGTVSGEILSFTTGSETPGTLSITSVEATVASSTSAGLKAAVNTGGNAIVGFFEWGTNSSFGNKTDLQSFPAGTAVTFSQTLAGLTPNTTYYFRAVAATSSTSSVVRSDAKSFTTPSGTSTSLTVVTVDAGAVSSASAELRGLIYNGGSSSTGWFEWGTSAAALTNQTTTQALSGTPSSTFSFSLANLQPSTTYFFRAAGQGSGGIVRGAVKSFTTTRVPSTEPQPISDVETGSIATGYVIVTPDGASTAPDITFTYGTVSRGAVQSQAGIIPAMMTTDATMFVEVIPSIERNIGVAIANPGSSSIVAVLTLRDENGAMLGSPVNVPIAAHRQSAKFVNDLFGSDVIAAGFRGSLRVQSAAPFAVIGLRFSGMVFSTLPVSINAPVPGVPTTTLAAGSTPNTPEPGTVGGATAAIIPQFALSGGWATQLALVNNTNAVLVGRIDVFDTMGNPMPVKLNGDTRSTFTYSIPAGGAFVLDPRDANGQSPF